jgi:RNA polymerase sigma-70 factor, ECF subfamily
MHQATASSTSARFLGYLNLLYRVLGRRLGGRPPGLGGVDVDDLVQETFARAFTRGARNQLDQGQDLGPYLATVARNLCIDLGRKRSHRWRLVPLDAVDLEVDLAQLGPAGDPADRPPAPYEDGAGSMTALTSYLGALPAELRLVYEARFVRGLSQRDAATELAVTRRQVRTLETRLLGGAARVMGARMSRPPRRPPRDRVPTAGAER